MPEVKLDGEVVTFEGNPPKTVEEVYCLLNTYLESKDRCLKVLIVDGVDVLKGGNEDVLKKKFWTIEGASWTHGELYKGQVAYLIDQYEALSKEGGFLSGALLREPWMHTSKVVSEWVQRVVPMTQDIEALRGFAAEKELEWKNEIDLLLLEHEACFTAWLSAIEVADIAVLSELLAEPLQALVAKTKHVLEYWVLEYFKNWEINHEIATN